MGRLELPLPDLGRGTQFLQASAEEMEARIKAAVPEDLRGSIRVRPFRRRGSSGLAVEYDDRAEGAVYTALEYPQKQRGRSADR